jgi:hypothetical protein
VARKKVIDGALSVDLAGLAAIQSRRGGKGYLLLELVQNGLDADDVTEVHVTLEREPRARMVMVTVEDDAPEGFKDLRHAHTLFARSTKADNPERRGMFNLGEKLVLASCRGGASVVTTTGTVEFDIANDQRVEHSGGREAGSVFTGLVPMTREEQAEAEDLVRSILPHKGSGLRRSRRNTWLEVHEVKDDEEPTLYVMGLPLVQLPHGDLYHLNVGHRIPCDLERSEAPAAVLRQIRTAVLNEFHQDLAGDDVQATWVRDSLESPDLDPKVISTVIKETYGENVAGPAKPGDAEAQRRFEAQGGVVVPPRAFTKPVWDRIREHGLLESASVLTPSHKAVFAPDGEDVTVPESEWTDGMRLVAAYTKALALKLIKKRVHVEVHQHLKGGYAACYGQRRLAFNVGALGKRWFDRGVRDAKVNRLILHELAHEKVSNHLSDDFHDECLRLGVALFQLGLDEPGFWDEEAAWREPLEGSCA